MILLPITFVEERPAFLLSPNFSVVFRRLPRLLTVAMVNRASAPSASSALRSSVVLSRAVEKTFALEEEVSRLWHHVSVLSRRLHRAVKENAALVGSLHEPTLPTVIPSSPAVSVVRVLGGGLDPESPRIFGGLAEGVAPEDVAPSVPPSSPPFVEGLGVGGLVPDFDLG